MNEIFLNNVRRVMEERNIDNQALADKCGWVRETVDRLFRRNIPLKLDMAAAIADVLGKTLDELCGKNIRKCKDCKHFEYDSVANVDGVPLIVAHEICKAWGEGCKSNENGYCFLYEPKVDNEGE